MGYPVSAISGKATTDAERAAAALTASTMSRELPAMSPTMGLI